MHSSYSAFRRLTSPGRTFPPAFVQDNNALQAPALSFALARLMWVGVLPDFSIIGWLLQFYIVYVVWEGAPIVMQVEEKNRLRFTILSSLLLILCPAVIQFVFNKLTAILN